MPINRDESTDIVPTRQVVLWESNLFPIEAFLTPVERTERKLIILDEDIHGASRRHPHTTPLDWSYTVISGGANVTVDFILTDLFYYYRQEQPAQAAIIEREGIVIHPISRNGLLYEWLLLLYRHPDKTVAERILLFRQAARQGAIVVNKATALTTIVPPGDIVILFPPPESHTSPAVRETLSLLNHYDQQNVDIGAGKENPFHLFSALSTQDDLDNFFLITFKIKIEFVFKTLWNIYKAEQPALAAQIEPQGLILHPISRTACYTSGCGYAMSMPLKLKRMASPFPPIGTKRCHTGQQRRTDRYRSAGRNRVHTTSGQKRVGTPRVGTAIAGTPPTTKQLSSQR